MKKTKIQLLAELERIRQRWIRKRLREDYMIERFAPPRYHSGLANPDLKSDKLKLHKGELP